MDGENIPVKQACIALRCAGNSLRLIAQEVGLSQSSVRHHVRGITVETSRTRLARDRRKDTAEPLPPSDDLAYLIGVFSGDGYLTRLPRTCKLGIVCDNRYPELIEAYAALLARLLGRTPFVHVRNGENYTNVVAHGLNLPEKLGIPCGRKTDSGYQVPEWVFEDREYVKWFVRGLVETDGGVYKRQRRRKGRTWECTFWAKNEHIMDAFTRAVALLGFGFKRNGCRTTLCVTSEVRRFVADLGITKCRTYVEQEEKPVVY